MNDSHSGTAQVDPGLLLNAAVSDMSRGALDEARLKLGQTADICRLTENSIGLAMVLYNLGVVDFRSGHHDDAAGHFSAAVDMFGRSQWSVGATAASTGVGSARRAAQQPSDVPGSTACGGE